MDVAAKMKSGFEVVLPLNLALKITNLQMCKWRAQEVKRKETLSPNTFERKFFLTTQQSFTVGYNSGLLI